MSCVVDVFSYGVGACAWDVRACVRTYVHVILNPDSDPEYDPFLLWGDFSSIFRFYCRLIGQVSKH